MNTIVLITGASKGIGYALAKKMLKQNFFVLFIQDGLKQR